MHRWDIINHLITRNNYKSYLEIGYFKGWSFDNIQCNIKTAVDPNPSKTREQEAMEYGLVDYKWSQNNPEELYYEHRILKLTSDDYFRSADRNRKWDIIFIDGLHEADQVYRDIENSRVHLSEKGIIVLHDMNPPTLQHTTTGVNGNWNGDCYKALLRYGPMFPFLHYTVDTDWGVTVLTGASKQLGFQGIILDVSELDYQRAQEEWSYFDENRGPLLNVISVEQFQNKMNEEAKNNHLSA